MRMDDDYDDDNVIQGKKCFKLKDNDMKISRIQPGTSMNSEILVTLTHYDTYSLQ